MKSNHIATPTQSRCGETRHTTHTSLRSIHPFLQSSPFYQTPQMLCITMLFNEINTLKFLRSFRGSGLPSKTWFPGHTRVHVPNGILIGSAVCLHSSQQRVPILYNEPPLPLLKIALSHEGSGPHLKPWFHVKIKLF